MFINLTNHPSDKWDDKQLKLAEKYGKIVDIPFPQIDPESNLIEIEDLVKKYFYQIKKMNCDDNSAIHLMGEFTFVITLSNLLHQEFPYLDILVSTTKRNKDSGFQFEKFRNIFPKRRRK